jgi:hypothetical protein
MKTRLLLLAACLASLPVHAALLPAPLVTALTPLLPGGLSKFLLHIDATGTRQGWGADGAPVYKLNGMVYAGSAVDSSATVGSGHGAALGQIKDWWLSIQIGGNASGYVNTDTRLRCAPCRITLNDGGVLDVIVDNPATPWPETNIPLTARLLPELGPVSTSDSQLPMHMRTVGCMGLKEVAGRGKLAYKQGTLCLNGVVKLPVWPANAAAFGAISNIGLESDSTLTVHNPLTDALTLH